jgi:predicted lipid carrier protein YhbT
VQLLQAVDVKIPRVLTVAARPLPIAAVQRLADAAYANVMGAHPVLFDRLGEHASKTFAFAPTDLPFVFAVTPAAATVAVSPVSASRAADVTVAGPFFLLLALLEGSADGDALFFSRDIEIGGDMEAIVALRNALDDNSIDLPRDLSRIAGPFAAMVEGIMGRLRERVVGRRHGEWN